jgi:DnaK suppressor protein
MAKKKAKKVKKARKTAKARKSKPAPKAARKVITRARPIKKTTPILEVVRSAKIVAKPLRAVPVTPLTEDQIDKFRDVLSQKRDDLMAIVQRKKEEEIEDIGVGDEADIATHSVEKEMLFELTDSEKQTLDMVESALLKLDRGVYGACESCLKGIPRPRLQLIPWARYCVSCQAEQEVPAGE